MATKTAMQELIELIDEWLDDEDNAEHKIGLNAVQNKARNLLAKEKQMVIDAVNNTFRSTNMLEYGKMPTPIDGEDYYTQTYTP